MLDDGPRDPQRTTLHALVREHLETFLAERATRDPDGNGLPTFVKSDLREYLRCGVLVHGAARFRCMDCRSDRLVALSCKSRAFCPRCGGRRMTEIAAHLVERVLPAVRVRQWVLTIPFRLRYRAAFDHGLALRIWRIAVRAIDARYRRAARASVDRQAHWQGGSVMAIQRFGSDLRLNLHFHALFLDGCYAEREGEPTTFVPVRAPTPDEVHAVLRTIAERVRRMLRKRGLPDLATDEPSALEHAGANALLGRGARKCVPDDHESIAVMPHPRRKGRVHGFDLDATVAVSPKKRDRLEALCRYILRPPLSSARLRRLAGGDVALVLRHPFADGTTHVVFTPDAFLERLVSLVPAPRANTVVYYGVLAARSKRRATVVPRAVRARSEDRSWASLMRRSFGLDVLACRDCGGRLRYVATVPAGKGLSRLLRAKGYACTALPIAPPRGPPVEIDHWI